MNDDHTKHMGFGTKLLAFEVELIETTPLDHMLSMMIRGLKCEANVIMDNLTTCDESNVDVLDMVKLVQAAELVIMHFELTREIITSRTEEEVIAAKKKFPLVAKDYLYANKSEDLTLLPAQYAVAILHDKLLLDLKDLIKKAFKKNSDNETELVKCFENQAKVKIMIGRFEVTCLQYPRVLNYAKDDIYCSPKTSLLWQDIYKSAVFRQILTPQEIRTSFKSLHLLSNLSHIIIKKLSESKDTAPYKAALELFQDIVYYGSQQKKASTKALYHLINPKIEDTCMAWNLVNLPIVTTLMWVRLPAIGYDDRIFIPRLFPIISKGLVMKEYQEGTIDKIVPLDMREIHYPDPAFARDEIIRELSIEKEDKIPIRILAPDYEDYNGTGRIGVNGYYNLAKRSANALNPFGAKKSEEPTAIVIHFHGGGFIAMSSAAMRIFLSRWVKNLNIVHFAVDYRKAPQDPYPAALDDAWQSYLWILNYAEKILGIKNSKIIVSGDSAGGNLAMTLALRCVKSGVRPPDGCLLIYPCLELDKNYSTPSLFLAMDDPMIHTSLLNLCIQAYVGDAFDPLKDPFLSPVVASDELLAKAPPIRIISGSEDPLQDGNWRFVAKLRKLKKDVKIIVHEHLSHAFMCHQDLKNFEMYVQEACELIQELIDIKPTEEEIEN